MLLDWTPPPWRRRESVFPIVEDSNGQQVAMLHVNTRSLAEMEANCQLVAMAPTLVEHIWTAIEECETCGDWDHRCPRCSTFIADLGRLGGAPP